MLDPRRAWALLQEGRAQLIVLRGPSDTDLPQIPGARSIQPEALASELATLDRERPIVLLSRCGREATDAMDVLRSAGVTAWAVDGGVRAWRQAGLPVQRSAAP